ncbi:XRE family transcriptional regulator [Mesorhizobium sp. 8]|uniref:helix-turn-helix domain-containing protein n=1 Tax=Mesorhizobium sp. 8 TaxID=2584466 RepID=UPI0011219568|nr:XRE family transcriptional regulator [Mesorhizobium sp. 8]QDC00996.1 cupin domain-containing protein [Mesorhizobium sp. 8]
MQFNHDKNPSGSPARSEADQPVTDGESPELDNLGQRIRELRTEKKLTLAALSLKSQISVGMLSHIERGQTSPSLKTLERLRLALEVPLARLFERDSPPPEEAGRVVRAHHRRKLQFDKIGLLKELLSPPGHSDLEVLMLSIEPGGGSGPEPWSRNGEKAGLVLAGRFDLTIGDQTYRLEEGDSFQFDSRVPHRFRNLSKQESRVLWIISSDEPG